MMMVSAVRDVPHAERLDEGGVADMVGASVAVPVGAAAEELYTEEELPSCLHLQRRGQVLLMHTDVPSKSLTHSQESPPPVSMPLSAHMLCPTLLPQTSAASAFQ